MTTLLNLVKKKSFSFLYEENQTSIFFTFVITVKTSSMPLSKIHFLNKFLFTKANFYEMPSDIGYSQLQIRNNPKSKKKFLAWMTGKEIHSFNIIIQNNCINLSF